MTQNPYLGWRLIPIRGSGAWAKPVTGADSAVSAAANARFLRNGITCSPRNPEGRLSRTGDAPKAA